MEHSRFVENGFKSAFVTVDTRIFVCAKTASSYSFTVTCYLSVLRGGVPTGLPTFHQTFWWL